VLLFDENVILVYFNLVKFCDCNDKYYFYKNKGNFFVTEDYKKESL